MVKSLGRCGRRGACLFDILLSSVAIAFLDTIAMMSIDIGSTGSEPIVGNVGTVFYLTKSTLQLPAARDITVNPIQSGLADADIKSASGELPISAGTYSELKHVAAAVLFQQACHRYDSRSLMVRPCGRLYPQRSRGGRQDQAFFLCSAFIPGLSPWRALWIMQIARIFF